MNNNLPLDSEFIVEKEKRPLWQQVLIFIIAFIILVFSILIIVNLIDIFNFLSLESQMHHALFQGSTGAEITGEEYQLDFFQQKLFF